MRYATLCSGIEGFGLGFDDSGMECVYQCEVDKDCRRVLERHYPGVERGTDVNDESTAESLRRLRPDLLAFGFPCQDLSVAGRRAGLAGKRSGLFFRCADLIAQFSPRWLCVENVPGLLSSNDGRDMGIVLGTLGDLGYGWAYRVLDAQWFGVAQRRRRVFIVGCLGDAARAVEVLFERDSLPWDSPPSREKGTRTASTLTAGVASGRGVNRPGRRREDDVNIVAAFGGGNCSGSLDVSTCLTHHGNRQDFDTETFIAHTLRGEGFDASEDGTGRGTPIVPVACGHETGQGWWNQSDVAGTLRAEGENRPSRPSNIVAFDTTQVTSPGNYSAPKPGEPCHPLAAGMHAPAIAFQERGRNGGRSLEWQEDKAYALLNPGEGGRNQERCITVGMAVRRLTPRECERLQGFPDDWTRWDAIDKELSDSARYRMLGNAVCVNVARWIGRRIVEVN